jgi:Fe-S-cluster-containing dehydrogenase component
MDNRGKLPIIKHWIYDKVSLGHYMSFPWYTYITPFGIDGTMQKCDLCLDVIDKNSESPPCVATCPTQALVFGTMRSEEKRAAEQSILKEI